MLPETRSALKHSALLAPLVIRPCGAEDLPLLEWFGLFQHHREIFAEAFARQLRGENVMLVADVGGFPVGQAWGDLTKRQADRVGYVWAVRVFPFLRNLGIGAQLMDGAEGLLAEGGYHVAEVGVERTNPDARRFYERLGYQIVGDITEEYAYTTPEGLEARHVVDQWLLHKTLPRA